MSETGSGPSVHPTDNTPDPPHRTAHWTFIAVPAATFVLGLLIGGLVVGAGSDDGEGPQASQTVTVSPSASGSSDTAVVIPQECTQAAETVQQATRLIRDNLSAIQDFKAQKIIDLLNELEDLSAQADDQAKTCSDIEVSASP